MTSKAANPNGSLLVVAGEASGDRAAAQVMMALAPVLRETPARPLQTRTRTTRVGP